MLRPIVPSSIGRRAKNVLIFSDGTGQGGRGRRSKPDRSNVRKLYDATHRFDQERQQAMYDAGLGAPEGRKRSPWQFAYDLVSQGTGLGISRNIKDCYEALIRMHEPGDRIFLFGFSRGAYTVRSLGGVLKLCGIPTRNAAGANPRQDAAVRTALVEEAVETVYKHYGDGEKKQERIRLGEKFRSDYESGEATPYFIGVWDTVRALGVPGLSDLVFWRHEFHDDTLNEKVPYARQALSIDENREMFAPVLWKEDDETEEARARRRIRQVWFPRVHSDIGGGYRECELSDLALEWMIDEATTINPPLLIDRERLKLKPSFKGMQHDERAGLGWFWSEGTREGLSPVNLYEKHVGDRFAEADVPILNGKGPYRPRALRRNKTYEPFYKEDEAGGEA
jgi:uncharacterized protein (DUF2235 family)